MTDNYVSCQLKSYKFADILDICNNEDGWHDFDGMCFKYIDDEKSWHDAADECVKYSATLPILDTKEKAEVFREVVDCKDYTKGVWIGLSDKVRFGYQHYIENSSK